MIKNILWF